MLISVTPVWDDLVPAPRRVEAQAGVFAASGGVIALSGPAAELLPALQALEADFGPAWRPAVNPPSADFQRAAVRIACQPGRHPAQGYALQIGAGSITVDASDAAGLFYAAMALRQMRRLAGGALPACLITDHPDFPVRGVMLDISRDKVPTMATLFALVDRFAEWRINHLELYTEHTFAYSAHAAVWQAASPMTAEEIRSLDAYCKTRCVTLVPNQNSFGHLERWLTRDAYRPLAECPDGGFLFPWSKTPCPHPFSLCPTDPASVAFLRGLYAELLPLFTAPLFNVGCDETWDVGCGRSRDQADRVGRGRVYLDFLLEIHKLVAAHGRTMTFWGDIIIHHPELVSELPRDIIALEWGYEADHPYAAHGEKFAAAGIPFFVCPGTSAWNSLAGRVTNARANLVSAAEHGLRHGASGYLITDWGDNGHWQTLPASFPGFVTGAAVSWCLAANRNMNLAAALDCHVFQDAAGVLGRATLDLGDAYLRCGRKLANSTELFQILSNGRDRQPGEGVTDATLASVAEIAARAAAAVEQARCAASDAESLEEETRQSAHLVAHAAARGRALLAGTRTDAPTRAELRRDWEALVAGHRRVWLGRNRTGGLADSLARFNRAGGEYIL